ncbi:GAF domain-containing protein [Paenibacillus alginolyticus]|uniref:GAF domain-containing protein n=1 Tax=Paenibacillus alginolyticus TaxID=59839 RepID=A0ABT4GEG7_9BACL|nr:GAF domain-containing protein [Paenibacillus alginolyticus]MCY9667039.1 GAF domain-containing protein [Paenibacillus alginolyticus]MCY9694473.1 GAF domain-containing protein [Paenibacillus alginolyticus]MEC0142059.1 GAF domain-containing protein [Paenibacillus alginolyticus]
MAHRDANIIEELERLRSLTSSDFIALAPLHDKAERIRWRYASGSRNERYQQMVIKSGQGLAGSVLRLGRWVKLDDSHPDSDQVRRSCPVLLAEQLQTAAVFPILTDSDNLLIKGLLFIGKRTQPRYTEAELLVVQEGLPTLAWYLKENTGEIAK